MGAGGDSVEQSASETFKLLSAFAVKPTKYFSRASIQWDGEEWGRDEKGFKCQREVGAINRLLV